MKRFFAVSTALLVLLSCHAAEAQCAGGSCSAGGRGLLGGLFGGSRASACAGGSCGSSAMSMAYGGGMMMQAPRAVYMPPVQTRVVYVQAPMIAPTVTAAPATVTDNRSGGVRGILFGRRTRTQVVPTAAVAPVAPIVAFLPPAPPAMIVRERIVTVQPRPQVVAPQMPAPSKMLPTPVRPAPQAPPKSPPMPEPSPPPVPSAQSTIASLDPLLGLR